MLPTSLMSFFMPGSGSHWLVPVLKVVKFLHYQIIHVKPEQQQIRTWVIDLSRSQLAIAIMTSKSHQLLGSIQKSSFLVWPISRLCNTTTGSWLWPQSSTRTTWRTSPSTTSEGRPSRGRRNCLGWTGKGEVKSNLFLTSVASPKALGCFVWIAANSEDVNHLHPVVGQWQRQLDVVRGLEPGVRQAVEHLVAAFKM